ncbi:hypothetical protein J6590_090766 [Homalodisca vitripennis]|nr:hypothetical protein J6590_090766 [Homalodisca vitripennis]
MLPLPETNNICCIQSHVTVSCSCLNLRHLNCLSCSENNAFHSTSEAQSTSHTSPSTAAVSIFVISTVCLVQKITPSTALVRHKVQETIFPSYTRRCCHYLRLTMYAVYSHTSPSAAAVSIFVISTACFVQQITPSTALVRHKYRVFSAPKYSSVSPSFISET